MLSKLVGGLPLRSKLVGLLEVVLSCFQEDELVEDASPLVESRLCLGDLVFVLGEDRCVTLL